MKKTGKSGHYRAHTQLRREPTSWHRPTPRRGIPSPRRGQGAKNGTPQVRAVPRHSYYSQRAIFGILFSNTSYSYIDSLRTLINN